MMWNRVAAAILLCATVAACTDAEILRFKRLLWPRTYPIEDAEPEKPTRVEADPAPNIEPEAPKVSVEAPKPTVAPTPAPSPVVRQPPPRPKSTPTASRRIQPRATRQKLDAGPDLPWPCWLVKAQTPKDANGNFLPNRELREIGRKKGVRLTRKQERQAAACLGR